MADRDFRVLFDEADWAALRTSVALVCREAVVPNALHADGWQRLAADLRRIGSRAAGLEGAPDLALRLLADFADEATCLKVVAGVRDLVNKQPEPALRAMTEQAAQLVDRVSPDQAFRFRATLTLVSMLACGAIEEPKFTTGDR